jgi:hypothetical protein
MFIQQVKCTRENQHLNAYLNVCTCDFDVDVDVDACVYMPQINSSLHELSVAFNSGISATAAAALADAMYVSRVRRSSEEQAQHKPVP